MKYFAELKTGNGGISLDGYIVEFSAIQDRNNISVNFKDFSCTNKYTLVFTETFPYLKELEVPFRWPGKLINGTYVRQVWSEDDS